MYYYYYIFIFLLFSFVKAESFQTKQKLVKNNFISDNYIFIAPKEEDDSKWWLLDPSQFPMLNHYTLSTKIYLRHHYSKYLAKRNCYILKEYLPISKNMLNDTSDVILSKDWQNEVTVGYKLIQHLSFCYPEVSVLGLPKSGTSAAFTFLKNYKHKTILTPPKKENCPNIYRLFYPNSSISTYFQSFPPSLTEDQVLIDGCIFYEEVKQVYNMLKKPNTKYIVLFRNYAEWLWSSYNFWCYDTYDINCENQGSWTDPSKHYRSNTFFHNLLELEINDDPKLLPLGKGAEGKVKEYNRVKPIIYNTIFQSSINIVYLNSMCVNAISGYSHILRDLWKSFSYTNTIILSNEQLLYNPEKVADVFEELMSFPKKAIDLAKMSTLRINSNDNKGEENESSMFTKGVYSISNKEPILDITRNIIEQCWMNDCQIMSIVTGFNYNCADYVSPEIQNYIDKYSNTYPNSLQEEIKHQAETYIRVNNLNL